MVKHTLRYCEAKNSMFIVKDPTHDGVVSDMHQN